jgi:hypothetical protein
MTRVSNDTEFRTVLDGLDPARQAALSSRMAQTSKSIVTGDDTAGQEGEQQYRILSEFLES